MPAVVNSNLASVPPESTTFRLARNLAAARVGLGVSQTQLAKAAQVARGTIVQIENGLGDPRLSTISQLAGALGISEFWLLLGAADLGALGELLAPLPPDPQLHHLSEDHLAEIKRLANSGLVSQRKRATRRAAALSLAAGMAPATVATTALGTAILPGLGTLAAARIGVKLSAPTRTGC